MKNLKRLLSSVLIICFLVSLAPAAFAAEDVDHGIFPDEDTTVGSITSDNQDMVAVSVYTGEGESVNVTVEGSASATSELSVYVIDVSSSGDNSSAAVSVAEDVSGKTLPGDEQQEYPTFSEGVSASASFGGSASVSVGGDVTLDLPVGGPGFVADAEALTEAGTATVEIGGNVSSVSQADEVTGVNASAQADYYDWDEVNQETIVIDVDSTTASSSVSVGGDVTVEANLAYGVRAYSEDGGSAAVSIGGDVSSTGKEDSAFGIVAAAISNGTSDVTVDGKVEAGAGGEHARAIEVNASDGGSVSVTVGSAAASDSENASGLTVFAELGSSVTATVQGKVSAQSDGEADAAGIFAADQSTVDFSIGSADASAFSRAGGLNVGADASVVTGEVKGTVSAASEDGWSTGLSLEGHNGSTASLTVGGDVIASGPRANGMYVNSFDGSDMSLTVSGLTSIDGSSMGAGAVIAAGDGGAADVTLEGGVSAKNDYQATGVEAYASGEDSTVVLTVNDDLTASADANAVALAVTADVGGEISAVIDGSIDADAESATALQLLSNKGGIVDVSVSGDVSSSSIGLTLGYFTSPSDMPGKINVTIEGTLSGEDRPVNLYGSDFENVSLTAWAIETTDDGKIVVPNYVDPAEVDPEIADQVAESNASLAATAEAFERSINYIIKMLQPDKGGTMNAEGTTKQGDFDVAHEGDTVTLKLNVAEGYQLDGVFNGENEPVALEKDDDGNYFIVVPKGGGVFLTAALSLIPTADDAPAAVQKAAAPAAKAVAAAPEKKIIAEVDTTEETDGTASENPAEEAPAPSITATVADENGQPAEVKIDAVFYNDNTFEIVLVPIAADGDTAPAAARRILLEGTFKFVNGKLTLVLKDKSEFVVGEDGIVVITLDDGRTIELKLDEAIIAALKKA